MNASVVVAARAMCRIIYRYRHMSSRTDNSRTGTISACVTCTSSRPPGRRSASSVAPSRRPRPRTSARSRSGRRWSASGVAPERIDEAIIGQVLQAGAGQAPARQAALKAGLPDGVSATTINKVCGSGMKAVMIGASAIRAGDAELIVAGGMESMNMAPYLLPQARTGYRLGNGTLVDATVHDGLWCATCDVHMGSPCGARGGQARGQPRSPGRVRAAVPPARDRGPGGRALRRRDRAGHRAGQEGRHGRDGRRGPAIRHLARGAREAEPRLPARRRLGHGRQRARASPTARPRWSSAPKRR